MADGSPNRIPIFPWLVICMAVALLIVAIIFRGGNNELAFVDTPVQTHGTLVQSQDTLVQSQDTLVQSQDTLVQTQDTLVQSQDTLVQTQNVEASGIKPPSRFVTTIRRPSGPPTIQLKQADPQGRLGSIACSTCHSIRDPDFSNRTPADLDQFHQNMPMVHGTLACYSCHNAEDSDTLRLADSTTVEYADVMTLCAQCHGTQARDYEHGAHGGMTGYWDLNRGPRTRNNCIDCHDPHMPAFPSMQPTFKPRDRFLSPTSETSHE